MLLKSLAGSNFNSIGVSTDSSLSEATKREEQSLLRKFYLLVCTAKRTHLSPKLVMLAY